MGLGERLRRLFRITLHKEESKKTATKPVPRVQLAPDSTNVKEYYRRVLKEIRFNQENNYSVKLTASKAYRELKLQDDDFKLKFLHVCVSEFMQMVRKFKQRDWDEIAIGKQLIIRLLRSKIPLEEHDLITMARSFNEEEYAHWVPYKSLIHRFKNHVEEFGLSNEMKKCIKGLRFSDDLYNSSAEDREARRMFMEILTGQSSSKVKEADSFGTALIVVIGTRKGEEKKRWEQLVELYSKGTKGARPSKRWLSQIEKLFSAMDRQVLVESTVELMKLARELMAAEHRKESNVNTDFMHVDNINLLRGMIWSVGMLDSEKMAMTVESLGLMSFKKIRGYGALSTKLGNACLYGLSKLPDNSGIARLSKIKQKIKLPSVRQQVDKVISEVATDLGKSVYEVEEMAVPDFDLVNGEYRKTLNDYQAILRVVDWSKVDLLWENPKGKEQKTVPTALKTDFGNDIKELKRIHKELKSSLATQKNRIESMYLQRRSWNWTDWRVYYHNHGLLSLLSGKLIWVFKNRDHRQEGIFFKGEFINATGEPLNFDQDPEEVVLWHPIEASEETVEAWREFLMEKEWKQPFKQAYREIYVLTDAEVTTENYSNRYAAHVLRQHQFKALCEQRNWKYMLMGGWDSHNIPYREIPEWGCHAEFWVEGTVDGDDSMNDMGIFNVVLSDQVRFYQSREQMNMVDVPKLVFSEIMRDVDLFVGVTSIGNDPNWLDGGNQRHTTYWNEFSFGDLSVSAQTRKGVLERLVPRLKIADQCHFEGNFLVVKGGIRSYKIHMGSSNILMKPNDQYLCIVPDRRSTLEKLYLPFDDDQRLSLILSKAFLLAEDHKIKDSTIISQIGR